jgi:hypothetical protein
MRLAFARWVQHAKASLMSDTARPDQGSGLGVEALVLAFVGGVLPAQLATFQVDLIELLYRETFLEGVTRVNGLTALDRLGVPTLRREASQFLVAHWRAPLPK